jgi:hypothetical protein
MKFKTHLEIIDAVKSDAYTEYLESCDIGKKLEILRDQSDVYPLPKSPDPDRVRSMSDKFNLYINILSMSLGQFIMLESEIRSSNTSDEKVASLIIRPKDEKDYDNIDHEREEKILESILGEDVLDVYSVIGSMMLNREYMLFTKFSGVLYNRIEEQEEEDEEEEKSDKIGEEEFSSQWFWYRIVRELAQGDITRFNDIYDLKMSVVMVELAFLAQKAILENARQRAEEARQRAIYRR